MCYAYRGIHLLHRGGAFLLKVRVVANKQLNSGMVLLQAVTTLFYKAGLMGYRPSFTHKFSMPSCTEKHYNFKYFLTESWRNYDEFLFLQ